MTPSRPLVLLTSAIVCFSATLRSQQVPPDPRPQATFKTGIDVVQLDVSVFDKDRRPIRGLTKEDFQILENGKAQPIVAVVPVDITEPPPTPTAAWMRDAPNDVVSNAREPRRLVSIVLDDAGMGVDHGEPVSARKIANVILDQLSPDDLVSVLFTYIGRPQNWTADRSRLRAAIESLVPKTSTLPPPPGGFAPAGAPSSPSMRAAMSAGARPAACAYRKGGCLVDTLNNVATVLQDAPLGRKILILISSNGDLRVNDPDQAGYPQDMLRALTRANVTVYAFDPRGLTTERFQQETDDLWSIAAATGGFATMHTNAPEIKVPNAFRENASYYLVGFRPIDTARDGRFRRVEVRVTRPGAEVRTRRGYYPPRDDAKGRANARKPATPLEGALTGVTPASDLPMTFSVAAFGIPGKREATLAIVSSLSSLHATKGSAQRINVMASIFDMDGKGLGAHRQTLQVTPQSDRLAFDVYSRIPTVKPGRYEVRFAAENEGRAGSVFVDVDVPNFANEDLALSGVLVERSPSTAVANPGELASVTSVKPTASRTFAPSDRMRAFLRVYEKNRKGVHVVARVANERDESVFGRTEDLAAASFNSGSADYQVEIPMAEFRPGRYLLTIEASSGEKRLSRTVRFEVR